MGRSDALAISALVAANAGVRVVDESSSYDLASLDSCVGEVCALRLPKREGLLVEEDAAVRVDERESQVQPS